MTSARKSKKKKRTSQQKKIERQTKKIARLQRRINRLRQDLKQARKNHKPRREIRIRLTRALKARRIGERPLKPQRPERIKRLERFQAEEGGTRELPRRKRRKQRQRKKARRPLFRKRVIQGEHGELVQLIAPTSYADWQNKLKRLRSAPEYKALVKEYPKITYTVFGHPGAVSRSLDSMIAYFNARYGWRIQNMGDRHKQDFFENVVIFAVNRGYRKPHYSKVNKTGRST